VELERIIGKCLEKKPEKRYSSAMDILNDLDLLFMGNKWKRRISAIKKPRIFSGTLAFIQRKPILTGMVLLLLIAVLAALPLFEKLIVEMGLRSLPEKIVLGVLPFKIDGGDPDLKTRCQGLTEYLSGELTQLESFRDELQMIPSSDIHALNIKTGSNAWNKLRIKMVVTGKIIAKKEKAELYLDLSRTKPLQLLRSKKIEVPMDKFQRIFEESFYAIVTMLAMDLNPEAVKVLKEGESKNPDAVMYYSDGLGFLSQKDPSSLDKAIKKFHSAIEKDSRYAMAHVQLGKSYWEKYNRIKEPLWVENAHFHCQVALSLNQDLVPALRARGNILKGTGEYEKALEYLNRAVELEPTNAGARSDLGQAFEIQGRYDEAEREFLEAIRLKQNYWWGFR
ncbi:MAG: tetratricopeptide repeat protein, partial [Candidatus Aminicenantes bacterium]|nr:tetratricopeptide repeat protein [Candidatus Aminicenantes bacterium]